MRRIYLLTVLAALFACSTVKAQVLEADSLVLVDLYNTMGLNDPNNTWLSDKPVGEWNGIAIANGRVTEISTEGFTANGTIPTSIGDLSALTVLKLIGVEEGPVVIDIHGSLPAELWNLTNLERLQIKYTNISGDIPTTGLANMTALYEINFQQTYLGCEIPEEIFNLPALTKAYLHQSNFIGDVPESIKNATNLTRLYLHENNLDTVPFVDLSGNNAKVNLGGNYFSYATVKPYHDAATNGDYSKLTDDFQYAKETETLNMAYKASQTLSGTVRNADSYAWFYEGGLSPLATADTYELTLSSLELEGSYVCKAQSSDVSNFDIRTVYNINMDVTGLERDSIALVDFYNTANLSGVSNWLQTPVSQWEGIVVSNDRVTEISTENLSASGTISSSIGKLSALTVLKLIGVEEGPVVIDLQGSLPANLWDLTNLEKLQIKYTNVTGDIPIDGIENMTSLYEINFQQTYLGCEIPEEIFNLPALTKAYLHQSNFIGNVPESVKNATNLTRFYLHENMLDSVPFVDLSGNNAKVNLGGNYFSFATVKPYHDAATSGAYSKLTDDFQYAKAEEDITTSLGETVNMDGTVQHADSYAWFKGDGTTPAATTATLSLSDFDFDAIDTYVCKAQSTDVSNFDIRTIYNLGLGDTQDSLILVDFYHTAGITDPNNTWLVSPLSEWSGVTLTDGRVTSLKTEGFTANGTVPESICKLSELSGLYLMGDEDGATDGGALIINLSGSIPSNLWDLTKLERLQIKFTNITGAIPTEGIEKMTSLYEINFQQTYLGIDIPEELFELPALTKAYLHQSNFTGVVPATIVNASNLTRLYLHENKLDSVPFVDLAGNDAKVNLGGNYFSFATVKPYHDAATNGDYNKLTDDYQFAQDTVVYTNLSLSKGDSVAFAFYAPDGDSYAWFLNAETTPLSTDSLYYIPSIELADTGIYTCKVQSSLVSNFDVRAVFVVKEASFDPSSFNTDIRTEAQAAPMQCYPNPCSNALNITCANNIEALAIYNLAGKAVYSVVGLNANSHTVSTANLQDGLYFIRMEANGVNYTQKIVKH